jgi:phage terminase large subunit GpA-like protein
MRDGLERDIAQLDAWTAELTHEIKVMRPSAWAEEVRYLPAAATPLPGFYRFDVAPYLREILDCMDPLSPVRRISVMKAVQTCVTSGVIENSIGYYVDHVKTAPTMFITADAELTKIRMDQFIVPMLQQSGLAHLIQANDDLNSRRTGKTDKLIEWEGGGFMVPFGAQNANKMRSIPVQILWRDEIDGWPDVVGKDGDPMKLTEARTKSYEASRKIVDVSTPLIKGHSKIEREFKRGDQRRYMVRCLNCEAPQVMRFKYENRETGEVTGFVWETENGILLPDSVRYLCKECAHPHVNEDRERLVSEDNAYWEPTAEPKERNHRSYHIPGFVSKFQSWPSHVQAWLDAWDVESNRPRDMGQLQVFYNNTLGESFEVRGEKVRFETVSMHRRHAYNFGEIPNEHAMQHSGSPILLMVGTVDVQEDHLAVAKWGWCKDRRVYLIEYDRWMGDPTQLDDPETWGKVRDMIENRTFIADDGKRYPLAMTVIDSGFRTDTVYNFCFEYLSGVYPLKGRDTIPRNATVKEFSTFTTPLGQTALGVTVDLYKDRWSAALRRSWDGQGMQPAGMFNAPINITDKQLKELTAETKRERLDQRTGKRIGFEWYKPSSAANELWDLLIYSSAALDVVAWDFCRNQLELDAVNWPGFWDRCESDQLFFDESETKDD